MTIPRRIKHQAGRHALVDGIHFQLPVASQRSPALMAAFPINADRAQALLPGNELHLLRWGKRAFLVVTVIDYRHTNIGKYIEYSVGIGCTRGQRRVLLPLAMVFRKTFGTGQYVHDLPVSTLISVKGGKGIWGMPKHQGNLDFIVGQEVVSSRYDLDGRMVMKIEVRRPRRAWLPLSAGGVNYCSFRGMLMKSYIYFKGKIGFSLAKDSARVVLGDHPRAAALRYLEIGSPLFAGFFPETAGTLDDHFECWFESFAAAPSAAPEGMESVVDLPLSQEWLPPPGSPAAARQDRGGIGAEDAGARVAAPASRK
jgi:acetoacetate decarboxylase